MKKALVLVLVLLLPTVAAEQFPNQNPLSGYVGFIEGESELIGDYRFAYPAVADGEDADAVA